MRPFIPLGCEYSPTKYTLCRKPSLSLGSQNKDKWPMGGLTFPQSVARYTKRMVAETSIKSLGSHLP